MKHIERFNVALLSKQLWHILDDHDPIWLSLLWFKYGYLNLKFSTPNLFLLTSRTPSGGEIFYQSQFLIQKLIGSQMQLAASLKTIRVDLWNNIWLGSSSLNFQFPELFLMTTLPNVKITNLYNHGC